MQRNARLRPFSQQDIPALVDVINTANAHYGDRDTVTEEDIVALSASPYVVAEEDFLIAESDSGEIVGGGVFVFNPASGQALGLARVLPSYERLGLGTRLLMQTDAAFLRRAERHVSPALPLVMSRKTAGTCDGAQVLLGKAGYVRQYVQYTMRYDFEALPLPATLPAPFTLHPFDIERDSRAVYEVFKETFAQHRMQVAQMPYERWLAQLQTPLFTSDLFFIAYHGEQIAGINLCFYAADYPHLGWIEMLGVRAPYRRQGLGTALLKHAFHVFALRGLAGAALDVDGEDAATVTFYQRAGMRIVQHAVLYSKSFEKL